MSFNFKKHYPNGFNAREILARANDTTDHIGEFLTAVRTIGIVDSIDTSGELVRIKTPDDKGTKKTGWYVFHYGDEFSAGAFGDWRSGEQATWSSHSFSELDPDQQARHKRHSEELKAAIEQKQKAEYEAAAIKANEIIINSEYADKDGDYLKRKQIEPIGLKQSGNKLIVPIRDGDGNLQSIQYIYPDGRKQFLTGGKIKGGRIALGKPTHTIYICEGYSTGATIHAATGDHVVCCMNAGNMAMVAEDIRQRHVSARIIVTGDNDQFLPEHIGNVGAKKAEEVALKINAEFKIPEFEDIETKPTDFNDLMILEGLDAVKTQLGHIAPLSMKISSMADMEVKPVEWVLDGVLSLGAPATLFAAGGAGKGYFIQQLAACIATGTPFFGTPVMQGPVLSVFCEDDLNELHRRQKAICEVHKMPYEELDDVHIVSRVGEPNNFLITFDSRNIGTPTEFFHRLEAEIARIRPVMVQFDTSGDAYPGSEVDKAQINQLLKGMVGALSAKYNCSFLLTGHIAKSEGSQYAGHMAWENSVRHRLFIDHDRKTGIRLVHLSKSNRAKEGELYKLIWQDGCLVEMVDTSFLEGELKRSVQKDCLKLIQLMDDRKVNINMTRSKSYAPKVINEIGEKKKIRWSTEQYEETIEVLLDDGTLELVTGHNRGQTQTIRIKNTGAEDEKEIKKI